MSESKRKAVWWGIGVVLITLVGGVLRFYGLGGPSLWIDEGFSVVHARGILAQGIPVLPSGELSWTYFPAHYLMALSLRVLPDLEWGARFFPALAGTLLVPAFYWMNLRTFGDRRQALLAAALMAFMTYQVAWSRQARAYVLVQLFTVLATGSAFRFLDTRRVALLWGAAAWAVLAAACHKAGVIATAIIALALLCRADQWREGWQWARSHAATAGAVLGLFLASMAVVLLLSRDISPSTAFEGAGLRNYLGQYYEFLEIQLRYVGLLAAAGAVVALSRTPRNALPPALAGAAFFLYVATSSILFHFRYTLPFLWIVLAFAACAGAALIDLAARLPKAQRPWGRTAAVMVFVGIAATGRFGVIPRADFYLGHTAPKPDWEEAYAWVRDRHLASPAAEGPVTVSTFPMFHDFYLGDLGGSKRFLSFSVSGFPGEFREASRYSDAEVLESPAALRQAGGFVVLDHFGLKMLKSKEVQAVLLRHPPDHLVDGPGLFDVFIWDARDGFN